MPRLSCFKTYLFAIVAALLQVGSAMAGAPLNSAGNSMNEPFVRGISSRASGAETTDVEQFSRFDTAFAVQQGLRLELDNRYGNVTFSVWDKNEVRVQIDIRVREKDEFKAAETMSGIRCDQVLYGGFLRLESRFDGQSSNIKNFVQSINPFERSSIDVDYKVTLPAYVICDISNQFGDIYFDQLKSPANINLRYGDLRSEFLPRGSRLNLEYGEAIIGKADDLFCMLNNAELEIRESDKLELESEVSKIRIEQTSEMRIKSRKDEINVRSVKNLQGSGRFSDLRIDVLHQFCDLEWSLGSIDIGSLTSGFGELRLDQRNSNVRVNIGEFGFALQAYLDDGKLVVPKEIGSLDVKILDEKNKIRSLTGTVPSTSGNTTGKSKMILRGKDGEILLYR